MLRRTAVCCSSRLRPLPTSRAYQRRRPDRLAGEHDIHDVTGPRRWSRDDGRQGDYFLYRTGRGEQEIGYIWLGDPAAHLAVIVNGRWQSDLESSTLVIEASCPLPSARNQRLNV
jgi:hypothetical protein